MASCTGKRAWPELVGTNGDVAAATIMRENQTVRAATVDEKSVVTLDYQCDRVRVFVDSNHIVAVVPRIG
ncbi:hypothetical protein HS088_TW14G00927 [Tripterygium wilfordii]|uniref:Uncharacterized protein n=1 Tax=Tripterygium wilfordii TaxID=458696 RepID=A0A7J7CRP6_TRIWF|nr:hypothetical protein HS088_TW14G00927 [Tripterygium wilfordii]